MYRARVQRLLDYGAMVELLPGGLRALLHISEVSPQRLRSIEDALKVRGLAGGSGGVGGGRWRRGGCGGRGGGRACGCPG